jgi:hypothetical protein
VAPSIPPTGARCRGVEGWGGGEERQQPHRQGQHACDIAIINTYAQLLDSRVQNRRGECKAKVRWLAPGRLVLGGIGTAPTCSASCEGGAGYRAIVMMSLKSLSQGGRVCWDLGYLALAIPA